MAFSWDQHQREFLAGFLGKRARRVEAEAPVAGGARFLDLLVIHAVRSGFFDFLPEWAAIENKAPGERFTMEQLRRFIGKIWFALSERWPAEDPIEDVAGVVLAASVAGAVRRWPVAAQPLRAGIEILGTQPRVFLVLVDKRR
ncbi:MAG: hypothetical protein HYV63_26270 [Candidatus Schekmanbacteria bacterium]|nr:hypothetical protein [Candidatus Schekmanbacteria bacterium]